MMWRRRKSTERIVGLSPCAWYLVFNIQLNSYDSLRSEFPVWFQIRKHEVLGSSDNLP